MEACLQGLQLWQYTLLYDTDNIQGPLGLRQNLTILLCGPADLLAIAQVFLMAWECEWGCASLKPCLARCHGGVEVTGCSSSYIWGHLEESLQLAQSLLKSCLAELRSVMDQKKKIQSHEIMKNLSLIKCTSLPFCHLTFASGKKEAERVSFCLQFCMCLHVLPIYLFFVLFLCVCMHPQGHCTRAIVGGAFIHLCTEWYATLFICSCVYTCVHSIVAFCSVE